MRDVHDKKTRSYNMSRIKGNGTKPEIQVRKFLFSIGFHYKFNDKRLSGKPNVVLPKFRTAIFIHGCFWHGHENCRYFTLLKTQTKFWIEKIEGNKRRDLSNFYKLNIDGWKLFSVYECELNGIKKEHKLNNLMILLINLSVNKLKWAN